MGVDSLLRELSVADHRSCGQQESSSFDGMSRWFDCFVRLGKRDFLLESVVHSFSLVDVPLVDQWSRFLWSICSVVCFLRSIFALIRECVFIWRYKQQFIPTFRSPQIYSLVDEPRPFEINSTGTAELLSYLSFIDLGRILTLLSLSVAREDDDGQDVEFD